jgi:hypothetical protein
MRHEALLVPRIMLYNGRQQENFEGDSKELFRRNKHLLNDPIVTLAGR